MKLLGAASTETVQVAYRIDGSTGTYTNIGSVVNSNSETIIYFGSNQEGLAFKSIQFRLSFVRGGTITLAPKLEYFAMDYIRIPETQRGFLVTVDCSEEINNRSPGDQINDLWTAIETNTLGTFCYRDTSSDPNASERAYLVKVLRPEGIESSGLDENGKYTFYLVELNDHPA